MALNGCSKKMCPLQVGKADNCNLTKEQCPYFTQDIDYHRVLKQIEVEVACEIFDAIKEKLIFNTYGIATISNKTFCELKKKYTGGKEDAEIH